MKDKEERGLRNFLNYCEDEDIDDVAGYSIHKWRRYIKIKKSGVTEIYVTDDEIRNAYKSYPEDLKPVYQRARVTAKTIRKWHLNMMVSEGVNESTADFIQGRAPATVGSAHYLNKVQHAKEAYRRIVWRFE